MTLHPRSRSLLFVSLSSLLLTACDGTGEPTADAAVPEMALGCGRGFAFPEVTWLTSSVGMAPGATREVALQLARDCTSGAPVELSASAPGVVGFPATVEIPVNFDRALVPLEGLAEGTVTLTARMFHAPSGDEQVATVEVVVAPAAIPACAGAADGMVSPGSALRVASGSLAGAAITLPEGAARADRYHVDPFAATIGCGEDAVPEGYRALGPPVTFGPTYARLPREIPLSVPIRMLALPPGAHRGHVEVAYRGPRDAAARIVPIASPVFAGGAADGTLTFEVPRFGTYQAVVSTSAPERRSRRFSFRGILGFSMGGSGSGRIGFGNPERFDFVAPLGGPTDWTFMLEHIRTYHLGGFCTEAERQADPDGCAAGASVDRTPPTWHRHEHAQTFEHWWFEDGNEGNSTFRRRDYMEIFRDLATMFGNPNSDRSASPSEPSITPPGIPDSERARSEAERCADGAQLVIPPFDGEPTDPASGTAGHGFFDDEYNPDGRYPVITFCDGSDVPGDIGLWDPSGANRHPIEVALAVDVNANGRRDPGEPVIRNGREPFEDFGLDGVPSEREVSADGTPYHPVENPDPAGDDFDFQYNPTGTERNWTRDTPDGDPCNAAGEAFLDVGLDGVAGTRQLAAAHGLPAGGFDLGEGNGCWDRATGAQRMIDSSPRTMVERMPMASLRDTDLFGDGGIRDLFNWVVMSDVTTAGWVSRGLPLRYFNGYPALHMDGRPELTYGDVPWDEIGRFTMIRYGSIDEEPRFIRAGDGGHVGTVQQLIDRFRSGLAVMGARWPDGDRRREVEDRVCSEGDREGCGYVNSFVMQFTASTGRTGPVSVVLPPGYFFEHNRERRYPVAYFLHGYGMTPEDLVAIGLLMFEAMNSPRVGSSRRLPKMILVFPDGRCRNDECLNGTFYTDAPDNVPGGAQMQTFMLDLMDYMDREYRTRAPESFEVLE
ncbi:MAG: hypothetical protein KF729_10995 [Sandaracinaceae bacterium]|nr:hypothetical protein [Sandaracinaceae bacterium]